MGNLSNLTERLQHLADGSPLVWKLALAVLVLASARVATGIANRVLHRIYWRRIALRAPEQVAELRRSKRQQTILSLFESLARYLIYGAAIVVAMSILFRGAASAVFGASLVVVLVGFGMQRMFGDIVAGGLLLFEGHYAVGDFISIPQLNACGVVEEFNLRNTTLRTLSGDRVVVFNGNITSLTRYARGYRDLHLELNVSDPEAARRAVATVVERAVDSSHQRFLQGPRLVGETPLAGGMARLELRAVVPPTLEWLVERALVGELARELGELLVGEIDVHDVDDGAFAAYRASVIVG